MNESMFWEVVQRAHIRSAGDMDAKCEAIKVEVEGLSKPDAVEFSNIFNAMMDKAYSWPLWGAAYVINGGCSDDTFTDFCTSLISRGKQSFEAALANPDSLSEEEFDEDAWFYEGYQYAVNDGLEAVLGEVPDRKNPHPQEPSGEQWSEDDLDELYPKLAEQFP